MSDFFEAGSDTFRSILIYGKEQESRKRKYIITVQKIIFLRGFDRRNAFFLDIEKSNLEILFSNDSKRKTITRG